MASRLSPRLAADASTRPHFTGPHLTRRRRAAGITLSTVSQPLDGDLRTAPEPGAAVGRERLQVALASVAYCLLLCSYYILRPVRDEMGVQNGVNRLQWLFSGTLVLTLVTVPIVGWVVKRVPRPRIVPAVYAFMVANLVAFYVAFARGIGVTGAAAFFMWLSVFNLLVVSLFWSDVSDAFSTAQSHRVYGYVAGGGTVGALAGPALTTWLAPRVPTSSLLALSAVLLTIAGVALVVLRRLGSRSAVADARPIGGSVIAGIWLTLQSSRLRGVALLIICYTAVSTVLYVEMIDIVGTTYQDSGRRTAFFASMDLAVNALALAMQMIGTRQIVQRAGLRVALAVVPLVVIGGLVAIGFWRTAFMFAAVQVVHRAGEFSLVRPGREMIYTTVDGEARYKAKSFIDTTVYRANDAVSAWIVAGLRSAGLDTIVLFGIPAAIAWMATGARIGARHDRSQSSGV